MALDFHRLDNNQHLFKLEDVEYASLTDIFEQYRQRTGLVIDLYSDAQLTVENQRLLIKLIDDTISNTNLNIDKQKTVSVLGFRRMLVFFSQKNVDLRLLGD